MSKVNTEFCEIQHLCTYSNLFTAETAMRIVDVLMLVFHVLESYYTFFHFAGARPRKRHDDQYP